MNDFAGAVDRNLPMLERAGVLDAERGGKRKRGKHTRVWPGLRLLVLIAWLALPGGASVRGWWVRLTRGFDQLHLGPNPRLRQLRQRLAHRREQTTSRSPSCQRCGKSMTFKECWACGGEGGFDDEDRFGVFWQTCEECGASGGMWTCCATAERSTPELRDGEAGIYDWERET